MRVGKVWECAVLCIAVFVSWHCFCESIVATDGEPVILNCNPPRDKNMLTWYKGSTQKVADIADCHVIPMSPWSREWLELVDCVSIRLKKVSRYRDNGVFRCKGDNFEGLVQLNVTRNPRPVRLSASTLPIKEGATVTFTCTIYGGAPPFRIRWFLGETEINNYTGETERISHASVSITEDMEGQRVMCDATVYGGVYSEDVVIDLSREPSAAIHVFPADYGLGDDVTLVCFAAGRPPPDISWIVPRDSGGYHDTAPMRQANRLLIDMLSSSDTSHSMVPYVSTRPTKATERTAHLISRNVTLPNQPKPVGHVAQRRSEIQHYNKNGGSQHADEKKFMKNATYTIENLSLTELGVYMCIAHNAEGDGIDQVILAVTGLYEDGKVIVIAALASCLGLFICVTIIVVICRCSANRKTAGVTTSRGNTGIEMTEADTEELYSYPEDVTYRRQVNYLHPTCAPPVHGQVNYLHPTCAPPVHDKISQGCPTFEHIAVQTVSYENH